MDCIIFPSEPLFLVSYVLSHLHTSTLKIQRSIFTFIETSLFAGMIQQHVQLSLSKSCKHFTPVPPSGSRVNCSVFETASPLNHLSACHYSFIGVICANQICWKLLKADSVLGLHHFGVLCPIKASFAIILFKMYIPSLNGCRAEIVDCCPLWHCCHPYFFNVFIRLFTWSFDLISESLLLWQLCLAGEMTVFILCECECARVHAQARRQTGSQTAVPAESSYHHQGRLNKDEQINYRLCVSLITSKKHSVLERWKLWSYLVDQDV